MTESSRRYRVLVLAPFAPHHDAPQGGARVMAQLLARLSRRHDITLLCLRTRDELPVDDVLRNQCVASHEVVTPGVGRTVAQRWARRCRLLLSLSRGRPMWVADTSSAELRERASAVLSSWRPDVVQLEYHVTGQYLGVVERGVPCILVEYEPGAAAAEDRLPHLRGADRLIQRADVLAWRRFERRVLEDADAVVVFTERDRRAVERLARPRAVACIPIGIELPPAPLNPAGARPSEVLLVANFKHPPNAEAAIRLARLIMPRVRDRVPGATLRIVGAEATPEVRRLASDGIVVTGWVPDTTPYLDAAAVVVAPLTSGGGMRVKVLEAMAAGKALVATPLAVEGLEVAPGRDLLVADGDADFAGRIVSLLVDEGLRVRVATSARARAEKSLGWERAVLAYEELYRALVESRARS